MISALIFLIYTIYYGTKVYPNKGHLSLMTGKSITMAMGMVSSLIIGLGSGSLLQGQLAVSTVLAILISIPIAFFIGQPFGVLAVIEALSASLMGSMMGAMLGEMLPASQMPLLMISMDVIYLLIVTSLILLIHRETTRNNLQAARKQRSYSFLISMAISILLIGMATLLDIKRTEGNQDMNNHDQHHMMKE
jgi:hypothetical protein